MPGMGQVALGFRSLLIKGAVFFVMAALLAWALGGTLWPRAQIASEPAVSFDGREWFWQVSVGGRERESVHWILMQRGGETEPTAVDGRRWVEHAGPVATGEALYYAGRATFNPEEPWHLERIPPHDAVAADPDVVTLPDRLEVERQLARLKAGLAIQTTAEAREQRPRVLEPDVP